jgi:hypothetical protein
MTGNPVLPAAPLFPPIPEFINTPNIIFQHGFVDMHRKKILAVFR